MGTKCSTFAFVLVPYVKKKFKILVTVCNFGAAICLGVDAVLKIIKGKTSDAEGMEISSAEGGGKSRK